LRGRQSELRAPAGLHAHRRARSTVQRATVAARARAPSAACTLST